MQNNQKITLTDTLSDGKKREKEIRELSAEEIKYCRLLGKGMGRDFYHCLYLADKHCKNFRERVIGFRIIKDDKIAGMFAQATNLEYIAVEFFEKI